MYRCRCTLFERLGKSQFLKVFGTHSKAGVVAPLPSPSQGLKYNTSLFLNKYLLGKIGYDKIVEETDLKLYAEGITNNHMLKRSNSKYDWIDKQYYLKGNKLAVVGSGHFVATYKSYLFKKETIFPIMKFEDGYEKKFIDILSDISGLYRLSTIHTYAYHMGNTIDHNVERLSNKSGDKIVKSDFKGIKFYHSKSYIPYKLKENLFKVLLKVMK